MPLTTQQCQRHNALICYSTALRNTRATYLHLLEAPSVSEEDKNSIWATSLILQYTIASHEKYSRQLESLSQDEDEQDLAILAKLYDQLTADPTTDLQGFIDEAQGLMQGEEFYSNLQSLHGKYRTLKIAYLIGTYVIVVTSLAAAIILPIFLVSSPLFLALPFALVVSFAAIMPLILGFARLDNLIMKTQRKESHIKRSIEDLLKTEVRPTYTLTDQYSYQSANSDNILTYTTVSRTHNPRQRAELKQAFFKPQMEHRDALFVEVQSQFNLLPK